ncbi:MAG: hypothetical protein IKO42_00270, partial [Opitutales bacterium]|nr:hypothetical protein [Opitutales bacterium]
MKREVRTIIKTALDKITAFVLSALAAFSFAFGGDVLVEAGNAYSNWWTSPTPDNVRIEEYVENASINKENSKIKDFHDYALNVTKLEIALRDHGKNAKIKENSAISQEEFEALNGKLAGLVDDFDYICVYKTTNKNLQLATYKDGEGVVYCFEILEIAKKLKLNTADDISLKSIIDAIENNQINKSSFKLLAKTTSFDKNLSHISNEYILENMQNNRQVQELLHSGYIAVNMPTMLDSKIVVYTSELAGGELTLADISVGHNSLRLASSISSVGGKKIKSYGFYLTDYKTLLFFNSNIQTTEAITYTITYKIIDESNEMKKLIDGQTYQQFVKDSGMVVGNVITTAGSRSILELISNNYTGLIPKLLGPNINLNKIELTDIAVNGPYIIDNFSWYDVSIGRNYSFFDIANMEI